MKKVGHPMGLREVGVPQDGLRTLRLPCAGRLERHVQRAAGRRPDGDSEPLHAGLLVESNRRSGDGADVCPVPFLIMTLSQCLDSRWRPKP